MVYKDHSNDTWHFFGNFLPPSPCDIFTNRKELPPEIISKSLNSDHEHLLNLKNCLIAISTTNTEKNDLNIFNLNASSVLSNCPNCHVLKIIIAVKKGPYFWYSESVILVILEFFHTVTYLFFYGLRMKQNEKIEMAVNTAYLKKYVKVIFN